MICTHPGRLGDILWSLATVKALCDRFGKNTSFVTSPYAEELVPFIRAQAYIGTVLADPTWKITGDCPGLQPYYPPPKYVEIAYHLGMREWPTPTLLEYPANIAGVLPAPIPFLRSGETQLVWHPSLRQPWISVGFTDEWAELKAGLLCALARALPDQRFLLLVRRTPEQRLATEFKLPPNIVLQPCGFAAASEWIATSRLFIGCKSALRVMALGLGCPTVVVEPSPPRHNQVFDPPLGYAPRERVQNGFDAREMVALVLEALAGGPEVRI